MITDETISQILKLATTAPSGSNSQPWRFRVCGNAVHVIALPEKDHSILNVQKRGTYVAHGALLTNLEIAASSFGLQANISLFPRNTEEDLVAEVTFSNSNDNRKNHYNKISERTTNRKPFSTKPLSRQQKQAVENGINEISGKATLLWIETDEERTVIGKAAAVNEIITLENKCLHDLFFREILWSCRGEQKWKSGFYVKTMELQPPQEFALRLIRHWPIMRIANLFSFARKLIARDNAQTYASAAAMGLIVVPPNEDRAFIDAGMLMEQLWLNATTLGLGFQLITGTIYLKQSIDAGNPAHLSSDHTQLIINAHENITRIFNAPKNTVPAILFRIGESSPPSAYSFKRPPEIEYTTTL